MDSETRRLLDEVRTLALVNTAMLRVLCTTQALLLQQAEPRPSGDWLGRIQRDYEQQIEELVRQYEGDQTALRLMLRHLGIDPRPGPDERSQ